MDNYTHLYRDTYDELLLRVVSEDCPGCARDGSNMRCVNVYCGVFRRGDFATESMWKRLKRREDSE